jgi:hypothetical protein
LLGEMRLVEPAAAVRAEVGQQLREPHRSGRGWAVSDGPWCRSLCQACGFLGFLGFPVSKFTLTPRRRAVKLIRYRHRILLPAR